jgi:hypothetical protein
MKGTEEYLYMISKEFMDNAYFSNNASCIAFYGVDFFANVE